MAIERISQHTIHNQHILVGITEIIKAGPHILAADSHAPAFKMKHDSPATQDPKGRCFIRQSFRLYTEELSGALPGHFGVLQDHPARCKAKSGSSFSLSLQASSKHRLSMIEMALHDIRGVSQNDLYKSSVSWPCSLSSTRIPNHQQQQPICAPHLHPTRPWPSQLHLTPLKKQLVRSHSQLSQHAQIQSPSERNSVRRCSPTPDSNKQVHPPGSDKVSVMPAVAVTCNFTFR